MLRPEIEAEVRGYTEETRCQNEKGVGHVQPPSNQIHRQGGIAVRTACRGRLVLFFLFLLLKLQIFFDL